MKKRTRMTISLLVVGAFILSQQGFLRHAAQSIFTVEWSHSIRLIAMYGEWLFYIILVSLALNRFHLGSALHDLGLTGNFVYSLILALLATLPMLVGYFFIAHQLEQVSLEALIRGALLPGVMEEMLFRGFLFGLLFRRARWGFIPAATVSAIYFALGHLYQSSELGVSIGIFLTTLLGGAWFAWLYIEWNNNLWMPIGLHVFMNLWWVLFNIGDNALGGGMANIFRIMTIAITVFATVRFRKQQGHFIIAGKTLFTNGG